MTQNLGEKTDLAASFGQCPAGVHLRSYRETRMRKCAADGWVDRWKAQRWTSPSKQRDPVALSMGNLSTKQSKTEQSTVKKYCALCVGRNSRFIEAPLV